jgi:hypothetical protein
MARDYVSVGYQYKALLDIAVTLAQVLLPLRIAMTPQRGVASHQRRVWLH